MVVRGLTGRDQLNRYGRMRPGVVIAGCLAMLNATAAATEALLPQTRVAIGRAVGFLARAQQQDGSFLIERCADETLTQCGSDRSPAKAWIISSPPTAVILSGLQSVSDPRATRLVKKGSRFLLAQMDDQGLFGSYRLRSPAAGPQCPGEFRQLDLTAINRSVLESLGYSLPPVLPHFATYQTTGGMFYPFAISPAEVLQVKSEGPDRARFIQRHGPLMRDYRSLMDELMGVVDPLVNAEVFAYVVRHGEAPAGLCDYLVHRSQRRGQIDYG